MPRPRKKRKYPCDLADADGCEYAGTKYFNYGFVQGTDSYCRKDKRFIYNMLRKGPIKCPLGKGEQ